MTLALHICRTPRLSHTPHSSPFKSFKFFSSRFSNFRYSIAAIFPFEAWCSRIVIEVVKASWHPRASCVFRILSDPLSAVEAHIGLAIESAIAAVNVKLASK